MAEGIGGVGGPGGVRPLSSNTKPPEGYEQFDKTGVWHGKESGGAPSGANGWIAGSKTEEQIRNLLNRCQEAKDWMVAPDSVKSESNGTTFRLIHDWAKEPAP